MRKPSHIPPRPLVALSLGLVLVLLALSAFVYSPWHRHNQFSRQACDFFSFEHAPGIQASAQNLLPVPELLVRREACQRAVHVLRLSRTAHSGRAPPA